MAEEGVDEINKMSTFFANIIYIWHYGCIFLFSFFMLNRDLAIRRDLEFESFVQKLSNEWRNSDIERLCKHGRKTLLENSPRVIKELFPEIWEEFKVHSRLVEKTRRWILEPILPENFDIQELENSIALQIEKIEWKWFAFRSHQIDGLEKVGEFFNQNWKRSGYIKLPTGMGKTILFSALIRTFCSKKPNTRVLILSPKDIVNQQNLRAIDRLQGEDTKTGITQNGKVENAKWEVLNIHPNALVSTYQLLAVSERDDSRFWNADVIILDELHRSFGAKTVEELKWRYPNAIFLGLSATPYLGDPQSKNPKRAENYIGECIMSIALPEAIESGALAPVRGFLVHTRGEEIEALIQSWVEITDTMYEEKIDKTQRTKIALEILKKYLDPETDRLSRRAMLYCAGIQHTEETYKFLKKEGIMVARVHSKMEKREIDEAIEGYKSGKYDVICNSDMLIEGFDDAKTSLLINIRPTRSLTTFEQMIWRAIRLDEENPGKIADIYNVTGKFSEEYTVYGLAKYYQKLQAESRNGSLVFPTKLSDIERKIQSYEKNDILPTWSEEERVLLKQYFLEWYSFFFATKRDNDKRPWKGKVTQSSEDSIFIMPDIIQTESVETIFFPMDFEYFENVEYMKQDYESWIAACGGKTGNISDASRVFMTVSGETLKMSQYLGRLMKNIQELESLTPMKCLFWLEEKLWIKNDPYNLDPKRIINWAYVKNIWKLQSDYQSFLSIVTDKSDIRPNYIAPHNRKFSFNGNDHQNQVITPDEYLRTLKWAANMKDVSLEEVFQWWIAKIDTKIVPMNRGYFSDETNLKNDFDYVYGKMKLCFDTEVDIAKIINYNTSKTLITNWGLYTNTERYLSAILETIPELEWSSKKDALIWWVEKIGRSVIRTRDFTDPVKIKKIYDEWGGITDEFLEKLRKNIPDGYQRTNDELRRQLMVKITPQPIELWSDYFDDIDALRHDFNSIKTLLGNEDITVNDINSELVFQAKAGLKISIKKYFDALNLKSKWPRSGVISWWKQKIWIVDSRVNTQKIALDAQYFLRTETVWEDYRIANPLENEGRYIFASQSGKDISINVYLAWIDSSIPEMRGKSKEIRMEWWRQQSELEKFWKSMNTSYFTQEHLQNDYESLKRANNGKPPTISKSALWLMFVCANKEWIPLGISLELYLWRLKLFIEVLKNSSDWDTLKWWKEQIKNKK